MIYTVTLNPSIDYTVWTQGFKTGGINRTEKEAVHPGGKGINVSIVLRELGCSSRALGFCAGFTGAEIERLLIERGVECDFVKVKGGVSRINVKLKDRQETEINGQGPQVSAEETHALIEKLSGAECGDFLVLAGSIPACLCEDMYGRLLKAVAGKGVHCVVDAAGALLLNTLEYRPFLIKPNVHELGDTVGRELKGREEIISAAKSLQEKGAQNVLVSMAGDGALLVTRDGRVFQSAAPVGKVVNSVGAGDSMVAGFIAGYLESRDFSRAFKLGLAAGSATAFNEWLASKSDIIRVHNI